MTQWRCWRWTNVRRMTQATWPLFDLRLTGAGVALRPMVESDLGTVAAILPDDLEGPVRDHGGLG